MEHCGVSPSSDTHGYLELKQSVSIIVPCYNGERTIVATFENSMAQSHAQCEIIEVNEGSTESMYLE